MTKAKLIPVPPDINPRRQCRGKTKYGTRRKAEKGLVFIWSRDPTVTLDDLHVYQCPQCRNFHIGHKPQSLRQSIT